MTKNKEDNQDAGKEQEVPVRINGSEPGPSEPCGDANAELAAMKAERDDLLGRLQRVSADYLNYQRRIQREINESREYANATLIKDMVSVLDDIDMALEHGKEAHDDPMVEGMKLVLTKAMEILGRYGLTQILAEGQEFDPNIHLALMQEPSSQVTTATVIRELQKGYMLKGRVLRPAKVAVAMPASEGQSQEEQP